MYWSPLDSVVVTFFRAVCRSSGAVLVVVSRAVLVVLSPGFTSFSLVFPILGVLCFSHCFLFSVFCECLLRVVCFSSG